MKSEYNKQSRVDKSDKISETRTVYGSRSATEIHTICIKPSHTVPEEISTGVYLFCYQGFCEIRFSSSKVSIGFGGAIFVAEGAKYIISNSQNTQCVIYMIHINDGQKNKLFDT